MEHVFSAFKYTSLNTAARKFSFKKSKGGGGGGGGLAKKSVRDPIVQYCRACREDYESAFKIKI